jgi:hypothetical protein
MKKLCLVLSLLFILNSTAVLAERIPTDEYLTRIKAEPGLDWSDIDVENIIFWEVNDFVNAGNVKRTETSGSYMILLPSLTTDNVYAIGFEDNECVMELREVSDDSSSIIRYIRLFDKNEAKEYAQKNGLSEPTEIYSMFLHDSVWLYAYYLVCDDGDYLIPYKYCEGKRYYNITNDPEFDFEIGKAYSIAEYSDIRQRERVVYNENNKSDSFKDDVRYSYSIDGDEYEYYHPSDKSKLPQTDDEKDEDKTNSLADKVKEQESNKDDSEVKDNDKTTGKTEDKDKTPEDKNTNKDDQKDIDNTKDENKASDSDKNTDADKKDETKTEPTAPADDTPKADKVFEDVPQTHWAYDYVTELANKDVILGYGNGYFGADDSVTHEQLALLLKRQFGYNSVLTDAAFGKREEIIVDLVKAVGADVSKVDTSVIQKNFTDGADIASGNEKYIAYAIENKLVLGYDGKLNINDNVTRAETAALICRATDLAKTNN